ncbi:MAG TPA: L,D-transpeptidase family protein [Thermoleophilaceae bacterium]|nr:L,D-transpeptidase family protein [Thermoleophilaceae bacterium]
MIPPEQLAGALERLDPRERELLALSLRRRVPDEALARVYDVVPQEVARRRAAAIERLADELGAQRGEDLGAVLQALLEEGTWTAQEEAGAAGNGDAPQEADAGTDAASDGQETADSGDGAAPAPSAEPSEEESEESREPDPESAAVAVEDAEEKDTAEKDAEENDAPVVPVPTEPVLEMLAAREGVRGPDAEDAEDTGGERRGVVAIAVASFVAAVIGGAAAFVGLSQWDDSGNGGGGTASDQPPKETMKHFVPQLGGPFEAPFPSDPEPLSCFSVAYTNGPTTLYKRPGGAVRIKLSPRTDWGSPRILGVIRRRGEWISVQAPELDNGEVAWMETGRARIDCVSWAMRANLKKRRLYVQHNGRTVRRFVVAVGRKGNSTPPGRFSVTDKLRVTDPGSPYGCCVLALSGHQTNLPPSWPGGDRLAVHATKELTSLGKAASLGCLRVTSAQARWLIHTIPLGTPLFVRTGTRATRARPARA